MHKIKLQIETFGFLLCKIPLCQILLCKIQGTESFKIRICSDPLDSSHWLTPHCQSHTSFDLPASKVVNDTLKITLNISVL